MNIKVVLASSNKGKCAEIQDMLANMPIELILQSELDVSDADETGTTFVENAIIKARHACKITGMPALADDSGLAVDALGGAPGVYSARYAGKGATDLQRIDKLLKEIRDVPDAQRTAAFHSVLVLMEHEDDPAPLICHGIWPGIITNESKGDHGFGYDPVFYVPEKSCTAAELKPAEKNLISHRGQAMAELIAVLEQSLQDEDAA